MTAIEHDAHRIDPLGAKDITDYETLVLDIYHLLSDERTLQFLPEKRLKSLSEARSWLNSAILNFHSGRNQVHFIRSKASGSLLGIIDIIPPTVAREYYCLPDYPLFIEFYLKSSARGKAIMSELLPRVITNLTSEGIKKLAAVVNCKNVAARKVLKRSGFKRAARFDSTQDIYCFVTALATENS